MRLPHVAVFLSLLLSVNAAAQDKNFHIFLCFGQSNLESGGKMEEMDRTVDNRFQVMADADAPNRGWTKGSWYEAVPPLAAKGNGICLVDYFGRTNFNAAGSREFGKRYGEKMLSLLGQKVVEAK